MIQLRLVRGHLDMLLRTMPNCFLRGMGEPESVPVFIPREAIGPCTPVEVGRVDGETVLPSIFVTAVEWGVLGTAGMFYVYDTPQEIEAKIKAGRIHQRTTLFSRD